MGKKPAGGGKRIAERIASRALGPWARERDETVAELTEQVKVLQAQVGEQREIIESHHALLSRLLLSEEMRPVGALKLLQDLCLELLQFVHQVCERHGITYWLDCGSLLGPVRHNGFIPWDDDIDIAMARPDYRRFLVALDAEIERLGLQDSVVPTRLRCDAAGTRVVAGHLQIKYGDGESMPGMVDVFPYDYLSEEGAARFDAELDAEQPGESDVRFEVVRRSGHRVMRDAPESITRPSEVSTRGARSTHEGQTRARSTQAAQCGRRAARRFVSDMWDANLREWSNRVRDMRCPSICWSAGASWGE